jgi:hypothetical protein
MVIAMFPNWTGWKTVKVGLFVLGGFIPLVPAQYQTLASTALAALGSVVVVLSGTSVGPTVTK